MGALSRMSEWLRCPPIVLLGAVLLAACSSSVGGGGTPASDSGSDGGGARFDASALTPDAMSSNQPIAATDFCNELTTLLCAAEQSCCTDAATRHATTAECFAAQNSGCVQDVQGPATNSRTGYDPVVARAVLNDLAAKTGTCNPDIGQWFVSHQGLLKMYQGTVQVGGDCTPANSSDAVSVLSCQVPAVCQLSVSGFEAVGTCGTVRSPGDSCLSEIECQDGLRCDPPEDPSGECKSRRSNGSSCDVDGDCESLICEGSDCVPNTVNRVYCFKGA